MTNLENIFAPKGAERIQKNSEVYKPNYKDGKNGVYTSIVRFLPNPLENKSIVKKYVSWILNPQNGKGMYVDSSEGETTPVSEKFWKLYNTHIATYQDYAKKYLSSKLSCASLVQIVKDDQHPEFVGQIKVFVYGKSVYEKLMYEENPTAGTGTNPFHPIYGRYFSIYCVSKGGFNNLDQSNFFDCRDGNTIQPSGVRYVNPSTGATEIASDNMNGEDLLNYLVSNCPELSKYEAQPWNDIQTAHVTETLAVIDNFINTGSISSSNQVVSQHAINTLNGIHNSSSIMGESHINMNPVFPGATSQPQQQFNQQPQQQFNQQPQQQFNQQPQQQFNQSDGQGLVSGVNVPNVAPQGAPQGSPVPKMGVDIDVDDFINTL